MTFDTHAAMVVVTATVVTIIIRFSPFVIFKNSTPESIVYLGRVLPYAIMGMLVVYCLKGVGFASASGFMPELTALIVVFILHKWKHNTLLSIVSGTVCYMFLVQKIFL